MRLLDRQMREIMMKQEARRNGHTYAVHRMNADTPLTRNAEAIKGPDNPTCYVFPKDVSSNVHTHVPCAPCMDAITEQV